MRGWKRGGPVNVTMELTELLWIFVVATFVCLCVAWGIGANDVANSFGSSVGSKALSMGQALIVAGICEFLGAVLLGSNVAGTIKSGIAKLSTFQDTPDVFMIGMLAVLIATFFWLALATFLEFPVSTSHSVVGSVVGMTIAIRGGDAVIWYQHAPSAFPYIKGMTVIFLSWVVSPILAAIATSILYVGVRTLVLRRKRSFDLACLAIPFLVGLTFFCIVVFIIQTGEGNDQWEAFDDSKTIWVGIVCGVAMGLLTLLTIIPLIRYRVKAQQRKLEQQQGELGGKDAADPGEAARQILAEPVALPGSLGRKITDTKAKLAAAQFPGRGTLSKGWRLLTYSTQEKNLPHKSIEEDPFLKAMHEGAEKFDPATEALFRYLQVFTAAVFSFAHGSNDVANSIGPYAAIFSIYQNGNVSSSANVPEWILVIGGVGIVLGLATYGYKIIRVLGVKMVHLTFSRGFAVELGAAIVIIVASRYGLPVSSTQTLTGSIVAIGLWEGKGGKALNLKLLFKIVMGWILTLVVAGITAGILAAVFVYSPNKLSADDRVFANRLLNQETSTMLQQLTAAASPLISTQQLQVFQQQLRQLTAGRYHDLRNVTQLNVDVFGAFNQVF